MGEYLGSILKKLIPKNIGAILGVFGVFIPAARELVMAGLRIADLAFTILGKPDKVDPWIDKAGDIFDMLAKGYETLKNFFLEVGE